MRWVRHPSIRPYGSLFPRMLRSLEPVHPISVALPREFDREFDRDFEQEFDYKFYQG
jgi:hypothetical protein